MLTYVKGGGMELGTMGILECSDGLDVLKLDMYDM